MLTKPTRADYVFNPILQIGEFLRQSGWKNEMTARNNPFTLAHNCPGKTIFEYLYDNPKLLTTRSTNATAVELEKVSVDMYPWATTLGHRDTDVALTIVDVGGSHGNSLRQIEACIQGLEAQFILQDLEPVIKEHGKQLRADGLIPMAYDFLHEVQPVQGILGYFFSIFPRDELQYISRGELTILTCRGRRVLLPTYLPRLAKRAGGQTNLAKYSGIDAP